jgi:hypothetical protein
MGWPAYVVIGPQSGGIFLTRYTSEGEEVGDTWHASVEEAKEQAGEEYRDLIGTWHTVPDTIPDHEVAQHLASVA